jgi:hypothetical protein
MRRAMAQTLTPTAETRVRSWASPDRFFSKFFGFPLSVSFHRGSPYSSIAWGCTIGPVVAAVQRQSLTPCTVHEQ